MSIIRLKDLKWEGTNSRRCEVKCTSSRKMKRIEPFIPYDDFEFTIRLSQIGSNRNHYCMIGVCERGHETNIYFGQRGTNIGWGWQHDAVWGSPSSTKHATTSSSSQRFGVGDRVRVIVRKSKKTLEFCKNKESIHTLKNLVFPEDLVIAVCPYYNSEFELINFKVHKVGKSISTSSSSGGKSTTTTTTLAPISVPRVVAPKKVDGGAIFFNQKRFEEMEKKIIQMSSELGKVRKAHEKDLKRVNKDLKEKSKEILKLKTQVSNLKKTVSDLDKVNNNKKKKDDSDNSELEKSVKKLRDDYKKHLKKFHREQFSISKTEFFSPLKKKKKKKKKEKEREEEEELEGETTTPGSGSGSKMKLDKGILRIKVNHKDVEISEKEGIKILNGNVLELESKFSKLGRNEIQIFYHNVRELILVDVELPKVCESESTLNCHRLELQPSGELLRCVKRGSEKDTYESNDIIQITMQLKNQNGLVIPYQHIKHFEFSLRLKKLKSDDILGGGSGGMRVSGVLSRKDIVLEEISQQAENEELIICTIGETKKKLKAGTYYLKALEDGFSLNRTFKIK